MRTGGNAKTVGRNATSGGGMKIDEFVKYAEDILLAPDVTKEKREQILKQAISMLQAERERADQYKNDNDALVIELEVLRKEEDALRKRVEEIRGWFKEFILRRKDGIEIEIEDYEQAIKEAEDD